MNRNSNTRHNVLAGRRQNGSLIPELCAAIPLVFALIGLSTDAILLVHAAGVNDRIAREAARAAAQSSDTTSAKNAASAVINSFQLNKSFFTVDSNAPEVFSFVEGESSDSPRVTVGTKVTVKLPFPLVVFSGESSHGETVGVRQQYTFPIVKLRLPKVTASNSAGQGGAGVM